MASIETKLDALTKAVKSLNNDVKDIKQSQDLMSKKYDELLAEFKANKVVQKDIIKKNKILEDLVRDMSGRLEVLEKDKIAQDIEIVEIPEIANEDLKV